MPLHPALEAAHANSNLVNWKMFEDQSVLESISLPTFQVFINICDEWSLSVPNRLKLLGGIIKESTYHSWKMGRPFKLNIALIEHMSLVLGIYKALKLIFLNEAKAHEWLKSQNDEPVFSSLSPIEFMLQGPLENLYRTRKYLDAWRGIR